jgi:hypothetical protein
MKTRLFALAALAACGGTALAAPIVTIQTDSLPSAQGWSYQTSGLHAGTAEVNAFTPGATSLTINTMGAGLNMTSSFLGARNFIGESALNSSSTVTISMRARVVSSEVSLYHYGFGTSVQGGGRWMGFGLSTTSITYTDLQTQTASMLGFNPTQWNDYRMVGNWSTGQFQMFVNDQLVRTASMGSQHMDANVFIGDSTGTANANVQFSDFSVAVPSPATAGLLGAGGLLAMRRRRA